jgi:hypothetical protein
VNAVEPLAGAVYVTALVVEFESAPQAAPVHPVPLSVHVTPALFESSVTVAVKLAELPGSTFPLVGPWMLIAVGLAGSDDEFPHPRRPVNSEKLKRQSTTLRKRAV